MTEQTATQPRCRMKVGITSKGVPSWETTAEAPTFIETVALLEEAVTYLTKHYGEVVRDTTTPDSQS